MRIEIALSPCDMVFSIPINYNYAISSELKRIYWDIAQRMQGNPIRDVCRFAESDKDVLFTFSKFMNPGIKIKNFDITGVGDCSFILSAPEDPKKITEFLYELGKIREFNIKSYSSVAKFEIKSITEITKPELGNNCDFYMMSPTTISRVLLNHGQKTVHYLRANDESLPSALAGNLKKKYKAIYSAPYNGSLRITLDQNYIDHRGGPEKVSKLITMKEGTREEYRVKGFVCPINIQANPDMMNVAYECGLGERNTFGLGMIDVVKSEKKNYNNSPRRNYVNSFVSKFEEVS